MDTNVKTNNRQNLAHLYHTLSHEDIVWSVKYLSDYLYSLQPLTFTQEEPSPSWWNRPLSAKIKSMRLIPTQEINTDYKAELTDILGEKYA